jgi:archaellin
MDIKRLLKQLGSQKGMVGTSILVIMSSMVLVSVGIAAAFLSSGMTAGAKSQETMNSALDQISTTLEQKGDIIAYSCNLNGGDSIGKIQFTVVNMGDPVDLTPAYVLDNQGALSPNNDLNEDENTVLIEYQDDSYDLTGCAWTVELAKADKSDFVLKKGDKATITVWLHDWDGKNWSAGEGPFFSDLNVGAYQSFSLIVQTPRGIPLNLMLTLPSHLSRLNNLH